MMCTNVETSAGSLYKEDNASYIAYAINPCIFAEEQLNIKPDAWQCRALIDGSSRIILNCSRQSGKSTVAAIKALHAAVYHSDSKVLIVSPSQRQSGELFHTIIQMFYSLPHPPEILKKTETILSFANGSRIISLPGSEDTIRGYSAVTLLIIDEAARVSDDIYIAVRPMVATTNGQIILLSTPAGPEGFFARSWKSDEFTKYEVDAYHCPRITEEFLSTEKEVLGPILFSQEYLCDFVSQTGNIFKRQWIELIEESPEVERKIRYWDMAATEKGDYTAGALLGIRGSEIYILDMVRFRGNPLENERMIAQTAQLDGIEVPIRMEEEAGASGKSLISHYARNVLPEYNFRGDRATGSKVTRAQPFAAACANGRVKCLNRSWTANLLYELEAFPEGPHDDQVDALSGAYEAIQKSLIKAKAIRLGRR